MTPDYLARSIKKCLILADLPPGQPSQFVGFNGLQRVYVDLNHLLRLIDMAPHVADEGKHWGP